MQFKAQKSTLLHDSTQRNYTQGRTLNSTTHQAKKKKPKIIKIGVNKTLNSENCFETGRLSNMSKPLTFHVIWKLTLDSS